MAAKTRAARKALKPKPYNPLVDPMMSEAAILARARQRAHDDTVAKAALLPSDLAMQQANDNLVSSLRKTTDSYGQIVQHAGQGYADDTAGAKQAQSAAMTQLGVVAGTAAPADTRGGLLGAMAANNLGAMTGSVLGAQQGIAGKVAANAGKRASIMAGENSLYDSYAQAGYDDAIRTAAARQNAALSAATLQSTDAARQAGIAQGDARIRQGDVRNNIAQQNADNAKRRLDQVLAGKTDKTQMDAIKRAAAQINATLHGRGKSTVRTAGTYEYKIPVKSGFEYLPNAKPETIVVTAKNGAEAFAKFLQMAKAKTASYLDTPGSNAQASKYFTGKQTDITSQVELAGSRTAALHEAARILEAANYTHEAALAEARRLLGGPPPGRKKKTSKKSTATSSQSR